jgi:hypothetical protein
MKSLNTKLVLSALGIAVLATPALAQQQQSHRQQTPSYSTYQDYQGLQNSAAGAPNTFVGTYPNGAIRGGSVYSRESGADDNVIR